MPHRHFVPSQVRDFSMIFDAYSQFEESLISALIERQAQQQAKAELEARQAPDATAASAAAAAAANTQLELDMRLERLERLMERRPELLSSVLLRQNPHSVHEWLKRAGLFESEPAKAIQTFAAAVKTVDPKKAVGKPAALWLAFARFYEKHGDLKNARVILRKAAAVPYRSVEELATVWQVRITQPPHPRIHHPFHPKIDPRFHLRIEHRLQPT
jgi:pre-mRNA-splicing factor SYF1